MSFEEALAELEGIVQKLERGQLDLESSIQAYERGTALRAALRRQAAPGAAAGREADAGPRGQRRSCSRSRSRELAALARGLAAVAAADRGRARRPCCRRRRAAGAAARGDALCRAGRRQAAAAVPGPATAELFGVAPGRRDPGRAPRSSCIHAYSLIHDDLPAMDERRCAVAGRPAIAPSTRRRRSWPATRCSRWRSRCWRAADYGADAAQRCALVLGLARAAGAGGHVRRPDDRPAWPSGRALGPGRDRRVLQRLKTGALIALRLRRRGDPRPGRAGGAGGAGGLCATISGLAFQIKDDLLDRLGDSAVTGKDGGRDQRCRQGHLRRPAGRARGAREAGTSCVRRRRPALTSSVPRHGFCANCSTS